MTGPIDLRFGRWEDALPDVECDALISDPPYGKKTHENSRRLGNSRSDGVKLNGLGPEYEAWTPEHVQSFVSSWSPRVRGWIVSLTSHDLIPAWQAAHEAAGRLVFAPLPCVIRGMSVRLCGDGPSSWTVFAIVARPKTKEMAAWGTLDGAYVGNSHHGSSGGRGKPPWLMHALVRDYSRPGDLVCDPMAGWGSTLTAATALGRRAIGAEMDPAAYALAKSAGARPLQLDILTGVS